MPEKYTQLECLFTLLALGLRFCVLKKDFSEENGFPAPAPVPERVPSQPEESDDVEIEDEPSHTSTKNEENVELVFPADQEGTFNSGAAKQSGKHGQIHQPKTNHQKLLLFGSNFKNNLIQITETR